jgi:hypothetical protein
MVKCLIIAPIIFFLIFVRITFIWKKEKNSGGCKIATGKDKIADFTNHFRFLLR